jgi:hypothetical protein
MKPPPFHSAQRALGFLAAFLLAAPALAQEGIYKPSQKSPSRPATKAPATKKAAPAKKDDQQRMREEGRALFGNDKSKQPGAVASHWSIVLNAYRDDLQEQEAQFGLHRTHSEAGLREAYIEKRGAATVIAYGRYDTESAGHRDLERIRNTEVVIDGVKQRPFAGAFLAPPAEIRGSIPEYDLRNARKTKPWAMYTLQMGLYGRDDRPPTAAELAELRQAAEQAAIQLRREGEEAYYYHAPSRSMVTIGTFSAEDFDPQAKYESPKIKQLRTRFPYNLYNGAGIKRKVKIADPRTGKQIKTDRIDPSGLVLVPRE